MTIVFPDAETRERKHNEAIEKGFNSLSEYILHLLGIKPLKRGAPEGNKNRKKT